MIQMEHEGLASHIIDCSSVFNWTKDKRDFTPLLLRKYPKSSNLDSIAHWKTRSQARLHGMEHVCSHSQAVAAAAWHRPSASLREKCPPDRCETIKSLSTGRSLECCQSEPTTTSRSAARACVACTPQCPANKLPGSASFLPVGRSCLT